MIRVEGSSNIHSHSYEPVDQKYSVLFLCSKCKGNPPCAACADKGHGAEVYDYSPVPAEKWAALRDAESVGSAFHREIKSYKHPAGHPEEGQGFKFSKRPA
jgi:hypothetical protein